MVAALVLGVYAVAASLLLTRVLPRIAGLRRVPRVGILVWQSAVLSVLVAGALAAVALALPFLPLRFTLADAAGIPEVALVEHYATPFDPWPGIAALVVIASCGGTLAVRLVRDAFELARERRRQHESLLVVGTVHDDGFVVIEHDTPVVYCLPGGLGRTPAVVVSRAALDLLDEEERRLVLGHEQRHLTGRHHLALALGATLARTFGRVGPFAAAHREIAVLAEMDADDAARTARQRRTLAAALVTLGTGCRPEVALGAGDTAASVRVRRLVSTSAPRLGRGQGALAGLAVVTALAAPVSIAVAPAVETAVRDCCALVGRSS
ncbi:M56 family metallopeptidase [Nocardioides zeae]